MTNFGTLRATLALLAMIVCVWTFADEASDAENRLRDKVVKKAFEKASKGKDSLERTQSAVQWADTFRKNSAEKAGDCAKHPESDDCRRQKIYEQAYCYLQREARAMEVGIGMLKGARCALTVKIPSAKKGEAPKSQTVELTAADLQQNGDLLFVPTEKGELRRLTEQDSEAKAEKVKSMVEVNFFHPLRKDGSCKEPDELDASRFGIGVKETVFPLQEKDEKGDPIPAVNFASQTTAPSLEGITLIGFGSVNQYHVICQ